MKLYKKKFPIYENCMISIFGQPGRVASVHEYSSRSCLFEYKLISSQLKELLFDISIDII